MNLAMKPDSPLPTARSADVVTAKRTTAVARAWRAIPDWVLSLVLGIFCISLLEYAINRDWVSDIVVARPSDTWNALTDMMRSGLLWEHLKSTSWAAFYGFILAAAAGIIAGGLFASVPRLERVVFPFVVAFQTLPKVALAPLTLLWFGFEMRGKVAMVVLVAFFPILVNTMQGLRVRDLDEYYLFKSLGASKVQLFLHLRFPGALPSIFTGLRLGVIFSLIGTTVAEFVGSQGGLGFLLVSQRSMFNVPGMYAVLVVLMVLGIIFNQVMVFIERKVASWAEDVTALAP